MKRSNRFSAETFLRSTGVRHGLRPQRTSLGPWYLADHVRSFLATRVSTDENHAMATSVHCLRSVLACAAVVVTWTSMCTSAGRRRGWASAAQFGPIATRLKVTWTERKQSPQTFLVCHRRSSEDCHANALQDLWDLHDMALQKSGDHRQARI